MKNKFLWAGLSMALVLAMVLSACTKTSSTTTTTAATTTSQTVATTTTTTAATSKTTTTTTTVKTTQATTTTATTAANTPIMGGTITAFLDVATSDPPSWDVHLSPNGGSTSVWVQPYIQWMAYGDIDKYGPRGSNQFSFNAWQYIPTAYQGDGLAASWEMSPDAMHLTFHIKQGIMWTGNSRIGMPARELTSDDCVFSGNRAINAPALVGYFSMWCVDVTKVDKYTFTWNFKSYQANWEFFNVYGGSNAAVFAPESDKAGGADWRNAVGTGPFIFSDYISGSSATFTKNPNYWDTTTVGGKTYKLPFIDKLIFPIIPDQATELAALRTGKLDWWPRVPYTYNATLSSTSPGLVRKAYASGDVTIFVMNRLNNADLGKLAVRQALFMGTDFNTINTNVYGQADLLAWPVTAGDPSYTPLTQQSALVQSLFTYNAAKAKQALSDAGYPNGFKVNIMINGTAPAQQDLASSLVAQWAKIGVTATITAGDNVSTQSARNNNTFTGLIAWNISTINPLTTAGYGQAQGQASQYKKGEPIDVEATQAINTIDGNARNTILKQLFQDMLADAEYLPMGNPQILNCYWPWLKNYYGETEAGYHCLVPMISRMWVDPAIKKSLGY